MYHLKQGSSRESLFISNLCDSGHSINWGVPFLLDPYIHEFGSFVMPATAIVVDVVYMYLGNKWIERMFKDAESKGYRLISLGPTKEELEVVSLP